MLQYAVRLHQDEMNVDTGNATDLTKLSPARPRIWTVFLVVVLALVFLIVSNVVVAVALAIWHRAHGVDVRELGQRVVADLTTPAAFILLGLASQLAIGLAALIPASLSPQPAFSRLGLVRPVLPAWGYPVIAIGALLPLTLGVALAQLIALVIPADPSVAKLYEQMTLPWAVPFILFIALAPGFMEELLFRGYVQTRLLQRWRPGVAILVTSCTFGIFHINPHAVANAFVIGLWLGVLAWRTGSVWPGIMCHAFINGTWNVWHVGVRLWGFPETPPTVLMVCGGGIIVACFCCSVWMISGQSDLTGRSTTKTVQ